MILRADEEGLRRSADALRRGEVVAFPTETVYGLGANALDTSAVLKIFTAKGRPADNPLIIHLSSVAETERYAVPTPLFYRLAEAFCPGPLTMILPRKDCVPDSVTAGLDSVAVRIPSHPIAHRLIELCGFPIAAPSANLSGSPSGTTGEHVDRDFGSAIYGVLDGGNATIGLESTVVSLLGEHPVLLRPGFVTPEQLREYAPDLVVADAVVHRLKLEEKILSPGLAHRHYAPKAATQGLIGSAEQVRDFILRQNASSVCVLCFEGEEKVFSCKTVAYGKRGDPVSQANRLFDALRKADLGNFEKIYVNLEINDGVGLAVYNRLLRACDFSITEL